ncbi:MAG TPA: KUP/HAK/KT family potassium transporter [Gemmatimonadales bacterium]|nr:KUP/HAK/KT family potassium transporter [Gemmatimonadales bacterium]
MPRACWSSQSRSGRHQSRSSSFTLQFRWRALGVVFGDIGTSPITIGTAFNPNDPLPVPISTDNEYGAVSLIFWSVMIIVTLTYVTLVMRADNDGGGSIMALIALLRRYGGTRGPRYRHDAGRAGPPRRRTVLRREHDHPCDLARVR